jgi:hypothetical protein
VDEGIRKSVPLFEYVAKNIGIRRAKGEYILATNPDIIFNPQTIRFLARKKLRKDTFYRTDRCDFRDVKIPSNGTFSGYLSNIRKNTFIISLRGHKYEIEPGFGLPFKLTYWRTYNQFRITSDLVMVENKEHEKKALKNKWIIDYDNAEYYYHCNVSGDFMLMHRDNWFGLRGNPEKTHAAVHTDALMVIMTAMSGLKEKVLMWPIYHQDHERRYDCENIKEDKFLYDTYHNFQKKAQDMLKAKKPTIDNDENWGWVKHEFKEVEF